MATEAAGADTGTEAAMGAGEVVVGTIPTVATEAIAGEGGGAEAGAEAAIETEAGAFATGTGTTVGPEAAIEAVIAGTTDGENVREAERVGIERLPRDPDEDSPSERGALFPGAVRLRDSRARSSMNTRVAFVTKNERYRVASVRSPHP